MSVLFLLLILPLGSLPVSASPQMERMGQPIADAAETVTGWVDVGREVLGYLPGATERLPYNVTEEYSGGLEARQYPALKWVCSRSRREPALCDQQRMHLLNRVLHYIQGDNLMDTRLPLTRPMTTCIEIGEQEVTMETCLPLGSAHQAAPPPPSSPRVYIKEEGERRVVTRRVGGWMDAAKWAREAEELRQELESQGVSIIPVPTEQRCEAVYQGQYKFWHRRNEVWYLQA